MPMSLCECLDSSTGKLSMSFTCDLTTVSCYFGLFMVFVLSLITMMLITHISFMVLSTIWALFSGVNQGIGSVRSWDLTKHGFRELFRNSQATSIYGHFKTRFDQQWLFRRIFHMMYERDLLCIETLKDYCMGYFNIVPSSEEALVCLFAAMTTQRVVK